MDTIPGLTTGSTYSITIVATADALSSEVVGPEMILFMHSFNYMNGKLVCSHREQE